MTEALREKHLTDDRRRSLRAALHLDEWWGVLRIWGAFVILSCAQINASSLSLLSGPQMLDEIRKSRTISPLQRRYTAKENKQTSIASPLQVAMQHGPLSNTHIKEEAPSQLLFGERALSTKYQESPPPHARTTLAAFEKSLCARDS